VDDWFDEPDTTDPTSAETGTAPDDWLDDAAAADTRRSAPVQLPPRGVVAVGMLLTVLLFGVLAAAGVFSGTSRRNVASTSVSTSQTTRGSRTTPTVSVPRQAPTVPTTPLKPGDRGANVQRLQRALAQLGYPAGTADGVYGTATAQAVTRFQRAHGLTADGVAGPQTLAALAQATQTG
jgi:putative peptidoglycan binding protein